MDQIIERWLPVAGWEGLYEVSDQGRVRSLDRVVTGINGHRQRWRGKLLKPVAHPKGYLRVTLRPVGQLYVHRLVLDAFAGTCPVGMEACHANGDPADNRLSNLRWDVPAANQEDRKGHGTYLYGETGTSAVLMENDVLAIRSRYVLYGRRSSNAPALAEEFGVRRETIHDIVRRRSWTHI